MFKCCLNKQLQLINCSYIVFKAFENTVPKTVGINEAQREQITLLFTLKAIIV